MSMSTQPENPVSTQKLADERLIIAAQKIEAASLALQDELREIAKELRVEAAAPTAPTPAVAPPIEVREWLKANYPTIATDAMITAEICGWTILNHSGDVTYYCQRKPGHDAPHETIEDRGKGTYKNEVRRVIPLAELLTAYYAACRSKEREACAKIAEYERDSLSLRRSPTAWHVANRIAQACRSKEK